LTAFEILLLRYQKPMFRLVYRLIGREEVAEDLVQDVFLKAFHALKTFQGKSRFSTWLYRLAVNTCLDHLKKKREVFSTPGWYTEERVHLLQQEGELISSSTINPEERLSYKELIEKLQEALEGLAPEDKTVIMLRELLGHSYQEIAEIMDWPIGTVRTRLFRTRRALQRCLRQYVEEDRRT
jgi:RNA polymerase sigma-70 factor (ECF subfamily)